MELSYATMPIFRGQKCRIYREAKPLYIINDTNNSNKTLIDAIEKSVGCYSLSINPKLVIGTKKILVKQEPVYRIDCVWKMFFHKACCQEGKGIGMILIPLMGKNISLSNKIEFYDTNNVAECEA